MTPEARENRAIRHAKEKVIRAEVRQAAAKLAAKLAVEHPEGIPEAPERSVPRLAFINGKTFRSSLGSRSGFSGHRSEQLEGNIENASRIFATEIDKILNPKEEVNGNETESKEVPVV